MHYENSLLSFEFRGNGRRLARFARKRWNLRDSRASPIVIIKNARIITLGNVKLVFMKSRRGQHKIYTYILRYMFYVVTADCLLSP